MEQVYLSAEDILRYIVEFSTLLLEFFGIIILVYTGIKSFIMWIKKSDSMRWRWNSSWAERFSVRLWYVSGQSWEYLVPS